MQNYLKGGLYSIYGCRLSKSGKRYNISLIRDVDGKKEFATISLPVEKVVLSKKDKELIYVKVRILKHDDKKVETPKTDDIPF